MASHLSSHGLAFEGGVLAKPAGVSNHWNTNALLNVADPKRFTVSVEVLQPYELYGNPHLLKYMVGIAPRDCRLSETNIETKLGVFFDPFENELVQPPKLGRAVYAHGLPHEPLQERRIEIMFVENALYLSWEGQPRFKVVDDIPQGDYRPCISIGNRGERLRVFVGSVGCKRARDLDGLEIVETAKRLWSKRAFTDATVVCTLTDGGEKKIPVHRCVLSAASPFFEKAFQGGLREAKEASVTINDTSEDVVEAFVQYLYTGDVPEGSGSAKLLPLAHRYECDKLLEQCAASLLETLSEQNCVAYVSIMQPFEEDPKLGAYWGQLADRIGCAPLLARALMRGAGGAFTKHT